MFTYLGLIKNRINNILSHDFFSWSDRERRNHLAFNRTLQKEFTKPDGLVKVGTYWLPGNFQQILLSRPYIISGGVEFHVEFESKISELLPQVRIDLFDVDNRSVEWFRTKFLNNTSLQIYHLGLSDSIGRVNVYGSPRKGWSSSVDDSHITNSRLAWEKVCEVNLVTIPKHIFDSKLSPEGVGILKLDVEGMADRIIKNALGSGIFPKIILFEMERAQRMSFTTFRSRVHEILSVVEEAQYRVHFIPRDDNYTSFSSEFLLISKLV